jgi:hypothetical protein
MFSGLDGVVAVITVPKGLACSRQRAIAHFPNTSRAPPHSSSFAKMANRSQKYTAQARGICGVECCVSVLRKSHLFLPGPWVVQKKATIDLSPRSRTGALRLVQDERPQWSARRSGSLVGHRRARDASRQAGHGLPRLQASPDGKIRRATRRHTPGDTDEFACGLRGSSPRSAGVLDDAAYPPGKCPMGALPCKTVRTGGSATLRLRVRLLPLRGSSIRTEASPACP